MLNFNLFLKCLFSKTVNKNIIVISIMIIWIKCNRKTLYLYIRDSREDLCSNTDCFYVSVGYRRAQTAW